MRSPICLALLLVACGPRLADPAAPDLPAEHPEAKGAAPTGAITARTTDAASGAPVAMVEVTAWRDGAPVATDLSDSDGRVRLEGLAPGPHAVTARWGALELSYDGITVLRGVDTDLHFVFDPRARAALGDGPATGTRMGAIEGRVLDGPAGQGFPGVVVEALVPGEQPVLAIADEEGRFRFPALAPERYTLTCFYHLVAQGNVEVRRGGVEVRAGETTRVELELDLHVRPKP